MMRIIRTAVRVARNGAFAALAVGACTGAETPPPDPPPEPAAQQKPGQQVLEDEQKRAENEAASATEAESDADVAGVKPAPTRVRQAAREADAPEGETEKEVSEE